MSESRRGSTFLDHSVMCMLCVAMYLAGDVPQSVTGQMTYTRCSLNFIPYLRTSSIDVKKIDSMVIIFNLGSTSQTHFKFSASRSQFINCRMLSQSDHRSKFSFIKDDLLIRYIGIIGEDSSGTK